MSRVARSLVGRLAQQASALLAEGQSASSSSSAGASGVLRRFNHSDVSAHYSPKQFSKEKPFDKSAAWVLKNPYIEAWVVRRDKMERELSWTARNTFELSYWVIGVSVALYGFSVFTIRHSDSRNHYPKRDMLLASTGTGFLLPDERDW